MAPAGAVQAVRRLLAELPTPLRFAVVGAVALGAVGGVVGLVLGLGYPPTAWFAVLELGLPAALLGGVLGLLVGSFVAVAQRRSRR